MTSSELRIGNLILTPKDKGGKPFLRSIIKEIYSDSVMVEGDRKVSLEDCDGIPLSEELLWKFSFTGTSEERSLRLDTDVIIIAKPNVGGTWSICGITTIGTSESAFTGYFSFIHQLQNLFYMLSNEEIKFK